MIGDINYSFMPVITLGLKDAFNPYALSNAFIFVLMLLFFGKKLIHIYMIGFVFIVTTIWGNYNILIGEFDTSINVDQFSQLSGTVYFIIGIGFLILGCLNFIDWLKMKNTHNLNSCILKFHSLSSLITEDGQSLSDQKDNVATYFILVVGLFLAYGCAYVLSILHTIWPKNYYLLLMYYLFLSSEHLAFSAQSLVIYCVSFCSSLFILWMAVIYIRRAIERGKSKITIYRNFKLYFALLISGVGITNIIFNIL